jgi:hypothetical protein
VLASSHADREVIDALEPLSLLSLHVLLRRDGRIAE